MDNKLIRETADALVVFSKLYVANKNYSLAYTMAKAAYRLNEADPDTCSNYRICKEYKLNKNSILVNAAKGMGHTPFEERGPIREHNPITSLMLPNLIPIAHVSYGYAATSTDRQTTNGVDAEGRPIIVNKVQCNPIIPNKSVTSAEAGADLMEFLSATEPIKHRVEFSECVIEEMAEKAVVEPAQTQPSFFSASTAPFMDMWMSYENPDPAVAHVMKDQLDAKDVMSSIGTALDLYEMLDIAPTVDLDIVSKASKKALLCIHPDKNNTEEAKLAYSILNEELMKFKDMPAIYFERVSCPNNHATRKVSQPGDIDFDPSRWRSKKEGEAGPGKAYYPSSYAHPQTEALWAQKISTGHGEDGGRNTFCMTGKSKMSKGGTRYLAKNRE